VSLTLFTLSQHPQHKKELLPCLFFCEIPHNTHLLGYTHSTTTSIPKGPKMLSYGKDKDSEKAATAPNYAEDSDVQEGIVTGNSDNLQRHLNNRQIQLIAIGGSIGTGLFISIGTGLYNGGAGSLLIAYAVQSIVLAMVNNCIAEMSTAYPVSGGFIRLAGKWVDEALGFMVGWNFLCISSLLTPNPPIPLSGNLYLSRANTVAPHVVSMKLC
jgi:amino acid permease